MRRATHWLCALAIGSSALTACSVEHEAPQETRKTSSALFALDNLYWPVQADGRALIRVCWAPVQLGDETFPADAPDLASFVAIRKQWVQEVIEAQWNQRTPVTFVGWADCGSDDAVDADVELIPMGSHVQNCQSQPGRSCASSVGVDARSVSLNMLFGYETDVVMPAIISILADPSSDASALDAPDAQATQIFYGGLCPEGPVAVAYGTQEALDAFEAAEKRCVQWLAVHELGHVAGFMHEQNRPDNPRTQSTCLAWLDSIGEGPGQGAAAADVGNHELGTYDPESVMNYCRTNVAAELSDEDVAQATLAYQGAAASQHAESAGEQAYAAELPPSQSSAGGCSTSPARTSASGGAWLAVALAFLARRRRH